MPPNNQQPMQVTPGQRQILNTVKDELFPQIDNLKNILVDIQACRISYQLYSPKLSSLEKRYSKVSKNFFEVVKKLETPDVLFEGVADGDRNIIAYFQFQGTFKQNISAGIVYVEIIDRTLDRKVGTIQNTRTFLISIIALVVSIYFAGS